MNSSTAPTATPNPSNAAALNVANSCLLRARATLRAVMACGDSGEFELLHDDVIGAMDSALGWLDMADKALNNREGAA